MPDYEEEFNRLSLELFRVFARFEYALKAANFHYGEGDAKPNWENFAASIENSFKEIKRKDLLEATTYLLNNPPKKQVIKNGVIDWEVSEPEYASQIDLTLLYIRRVRNNLFHGGKFHGHWFEPVRDYDLLRHSLTVLYACLESSDAARDAYEG